MLSFSPVVGIRTPPTPRPQASVAPSFGSGGRGTLAGEKGGERVPIPTRGHTLWYSFYVCTLWVTGTMWACSSEAHAQNHSLWMANYLTAYRYRTAFDVIINNISAGHKT